MKKFIILILLLFPIVTLSQSLKENYLQAQEEYENGDYIACIDRAIKVKQSLGRTNPKIETLLTNAYYKSENYTQAILSIERLKMMVTSTVFDSEKYDSIRELEKKIYTSLNGLENFYKAEREKEELNKSKKLEEELEELEQKYTQKVADLFSQKTESEIEPIWSQTIDDINDLKIFYRDAEDYKNVIEIYKIFIDKISDFGDNAYKVEAEERIRKAQKGLASLIEKEKETKRIELITLQKLTCSTDPYSLTSTSIYLPRDVMSVPSCIGNLSNLEELVINSPHIKYLPESIGNLKKLKRLDINHTSIQSLPESIGELENLTYLGLHWNDLSSLPKSIGNLSNLLTLRLNGNSKLDSIPASMENLKKLKVLDLSNILLMQSLPAIIYNLPSLNKLYLSSMIGLKEIPEWIGELSKLEVLDMSRMTIEVLPESIVNLENLNYLDLSWSEFKYLPENMGDFRSLETLNLRSSEILNLPTSLCEISTLKYIFVSKNGDKKRLGKLTKPIKKCMIKFIWM